MLLCKLYFQSSQTFASTKSRYEISLQSSLRVFESASLMVPLVGLVILNQFVVASIFGVGIIDSLLCVLRFAMVLDFCTTGCCFAELISAW